MQEKTKPTSEDIQIISQIRPMYGHTLSGFAQGEGSFHLVTRKRDDYYYGFRFTICFNVSNKDSKIISLFKTVLKCGTTRPAGMRSGDKFYLYEIDSAKLIVRRIIPFFKRFCLLNSITARNFRGFSKMALILADHSPLTLEDILELLKLRNTLLNAPKHDRTDLSLLVQIKHRLETKLKTFNFKTTEIEEQSRLECEFETVNNCIKQMKKQKTLLWVG